MSTQVATVLVVEDEAQIRKFLRISLEAEGYRVLEARRGADGLAMCAAERPDLAILDLGLPDLDGREVIERLREWTGIPILVLSVRESESEKVAALDAGANDYVTKPFGIRELMARIRALLREQAANDAQPPVFEAEGLRIDMAQREVSVDGEPVHLSRKEYQLLHFLVANRGKVITHANMLREVWGPAYLDQTHYLRVLIGQLRQKLGDDPSHPRFIITVQGVGYRLALS